MHRFKLPISFVSSICAALACTALATAAPAGTSIPVVPALDGAPDPGFKTRFQKLATQNAKDDMAKLVKAESKDAVLWIVATGEELLTKPSPEAEVFMTDLRAAWKSAMKSEFAEKIYTYFTTFDATNKKDHRELHQRYDKVWDEYSGNLDKKDNWTFLNLVDEFELLANAFDQIGDLYWSSQAWLVYAACHDEPLRGEAADPKKALQGYTNALDIRNKLDLKDAGYEEATRRKSALTGKAPEPSGPDKKKKDSPTAPPAAAPPKPAVLGEPVTVPMNFEVVPTIDTFQRPNYHCDDFYTLWNALNFTKKGSSSKFPNTPDAPIGYRTNSTEVRFDLDGGGQGDEKLALTGNMTPVKIALGKGAAARPWAFLAVTGTDKDFYQGIQVNLAGTDDKLNVYILAAASIVGDVNGVPVRIIDESMDGIYGTPPLTWGFPGLTPGIFQPDVDSMVIGTSKRAKPWSSIQQIGGAWYKLDVNADGKEMKAAPMTVETGVLKLDFKGPAPTYVVVHGKDPQNDSYFDLVEGGSKGVTVPTGKYVLYYGEVRKGKKSQMQKTTILPPAKDPPQWVVGHGETVTVTLGAPFSFDFKYAFEAEKLTVDPITVAVVGSAGERYERPWNCVPNPEISWRKKGSKKPNKPEKMGHVEDADAIQALGWLAAWAPLKHEIDLKGVEGPIEVQLSEKKHDVFGKVESPWKE